MTLDLHQDPYIAEPLSYAYTFGDSDIAGKLSKGIAFLFSKYTVKHESGVASVSAFTDRAS